MKCFYLASVSTANVSLRGNNCRTKSLERNEQSERVSTGGLWGDGDQWGVGHIASVDHRPPLRRSALPHPIPPHSDFQIVLELGTNETQSASCRHVPLFGPYPTGGPFWVLPISCFLGGGSQYLGNLICSVLFFISVLLCFVCYRSSAPPASKPCLSETWSRVESSRSARSQHTTGLAPTPLAASQLRLPASLASPQLHVAPFRPRLSSNFNYAAILTPLSAGTATVLATGPSPAGTLSQSISCLSNPTPSKITYSKSSALLSLVHPMSNLRGADGEETDQTKLPSFRSPCFFNCF